MPGLASPEQAVEWFNAQRTVNGLPAGITLVPEWSEACAKHVNYLENSPAASVIADGAHAERPGSPFYTEEGAWAGARSVIGGWFSEPRKKNPSNFSGFDLRSFRFPWHGVNSYEWAPIHLGQMLRPAIARTGYATGCMVVSDDSRPPPPSPRMFTYPGDGTSFIYPSERAGESPDVPAVLAGDLPRNATTGPYLMIFSWGTGAGRLTNASVVGPSGPVSLFTYDAHTPGAGGFIGPGGMLLPVNPLRGLTTYRADATFTPDDSGGAAMPVSWSFKTAGTPNWLRLNTGVMPRSGGRILMSVGSPVPNVATVRITGPGARNKKLNLGKPLVSHYETTEYAFNRSLPGFRPGRWRVCATSGGGTTGYEVKKVCKSFRVR